MGKTQLANVRVTAAKSRAALRGTDRIWVIIMISLQQIRCDNSRPFLSWFPSCTWEPDSSWKLHFSEIGIMRTNRSVGALPRLELESVAMRKRTLRVRVRRGAGVAFPSATWERKKIAAVIIKPCLRDLAAGAVMNTNKENFPFHSEQQATDTLGSLRRARSFLNRFRSLLNTESVCAQSWRHFRFTSNSRSRFPANE